MGDTQTPLLQVAALEKQFPGVRALHDVDLTLNRGEVLAVVGENGAGKSTLKKILAGVNTPNAGTIRIDGTEVRVQSVRDAQAHGIAPAPVTGSQRKSATDTVGVVALDAEGVFAVASSTGGVTGRPAGRVGDTPHWGGGLWTDAGIGIAATGIGEAISRRLLCFRVAQKMANGLSLAEALAWGVALYPADVEIGLIALSKGEGIGISNTSMPWALRQD